MRRLTVEVRGIKVATWLPPEALPADLVEPEGPAGAVEIELAIKGGPVRVLGILAGRTVRRALRIIAEKGVDHVHLMLRGTLRPPLGPGKPLELEDASVTAYPKASPEPSQ